MDRPRPDTRYVVLIGDGMGDYPVEELGGRTPLEAARTPNMDRIAACGIGLARTIPGGMEPGSDIANLCLLGYDPARYHTGRAPLEASSMGVELGPHQVAFRMNLVTLEFRSHDEIIMLSHSAGDISTAEGRRIVEDLRSGLERPGLAVYPGVAYRHLLVWDEGPEQAETIPPHDVLDRNMAPYLHAENGNPVVPLMRGSWELLKAHPVNRERRKRGLKTADSIWLWGQGRRPAIPPFLDRFGLRGGVISAVDLIKGIGIYMGFESIHVEGATGYLDTNYLGKANGALEALERLDFVFVHVEAPDEAGHAADPHEKVEAIEAFDEKVVGRVLEGLEAFADYRILVAGDHLTPVSVKTHTNEPTPFAWADKAQLAGNTGGPSFTEKAAAGSGLFYERGHDLMPDFLGIDRGRRG